jgi:hypothetical protein
MKLEAGKKYRRRDGLIVKLVWAHAVPRLTAEHEPEKHWYDPARADGNYVFNLRTSPADLIEEIPDEKN